MTAADIVAILEQKFGGRIRSKNLTAIDPISQDAKPIAEQARVTAIEVGHQVAALGDTQRKSIGKSH